MRMDTRMCVIWPWGLDPAGSVSRTLVDSCAHGNKISGYTTDREFPDRWRRYCILKEDICILVESWVPNMILHIHQPLFSLHKTVDAVTIDMLR
jgi:hypothetical protein